MTGADPVQCPICGWTGQPDDLAETAGDSVCPVCDEDIGHVG